VRSLEGVTGSKLKADLGVMGVRYNGESAALKLVSKLSGELLARDELDVDLLA
jgi:hypothetical protein